MKNILVTGGTGFLAGWIIRKLLEKGYSVRTTVRSNKKGECVREMLEHEGVDTSNFNYIIAELTQLVGWEEAMKGIDCVLHVASPLSGNNHEDPTMILTAKKGIENIIKTAIKVGIKKIVMTSSEAACYPEKSNTNSAIDEYFWTNMDNKYITNYMRSKIIQEKTAWELINNQKKTTLVTILPGAILGPFMDGRRGSTDMIFEMILKGLPSPNAIYPVVDVRDLADLHILALESNKADGHRFIAETEEMTMPEIAKILKENMGIRGKKINTIVIPDFLIGFLAHFNVSMKVLNSMIGLKYHRSNRKSIDVLNWRPRPAKETVIDSANYLIKYSII